MQINKIAKQLGKRGGEKTASLHGKKHFSEAGKKGMEKRWGNRINLEDPSKQLIEYSENLGQVLVYLLKKYTDNQFGTVDYDEFGLAIYRMMRQLKLIK